MLKLFIGNWHITMANLYLRVQEKQFKKLDAIVSKIKISENTAPILDIQYSCHSMIFEFANTRGTKHINKARKLLENS